MTGIRTAQICDMVSNPRIELGFPRAPAQLTGEAREVLGRIHESREKERQRHNASIQRPSAGTRVATDDHLVLARESDSSLHRQGMGPNLVHEKWTGPGEVVGVVIDGSSFVIEMEGQATRSRTVPTASLKPFYTRTVRPTASHGGRVRTNGVGSGPRARSTLDHFAASMYTVLGRRRVVSA